MTSQKEKTILITGACGFVGKHLVNHLLRKNICSKIIVCCRDMEKAGELYGSDEKISIATADLLHPSSYQDIFENNNPRLIIHLAALARFKQGEEYPEETIKANFLATVKLLETAKRFGVEKFLAASSNLARNPKGVTGISKFLTEAYVKQYVEPPETISIRLPNVAGSKGSVSRIFKQQIEKNAPITITDPRMSRKFITPREAAHELLFALENGNHGDIFINNKPSTPIVDLAKEMIEQSGKKNTAPLHWHACRRKITGSRLSG